MMVLKEDFVVWVLLGVIDMVLAVLEEPVQVSASLAVKYIRNLKENVFIVVKIAAEQVIVFNVSVLFTCKVCRL